MSLTLTATFDEPTGTVALQATSDVDHTYGNYSLVRNDATGTATVRTQENLGFTSGVLNVIDNEPALSGLVTYTIVAATETATDSVSPATLRTWLKFPIMPHLSLELTDLAADYTAGWEPSDTPFTPLDRDDPIIVFGSFGLRRGSFSVLCSSYAEGRAIAEAYRATRIALLQVPDPVAASMYHAVSRVQLRMFQERTRYWMLTGEYTEVARPVGPVLGTLGWDYADVAATYASYDEVYATFDTYNDVTVGP